jgi:hypothetical protein
VRLENDTKCLSVETADAVALIDVVELAERLRRTRQRWRTTGLGAGLGHWLLDVGSILLESGAYDEASRDDPRWYETYSVLDHEGLRQQLGEYLFAIGEAPLASRLALFPRQRRG